MSVNVSISYDYELIWGVWDKVSPAYIDRNVRQANAVTEQLIDLHIKYDIPCTFAIVGAMLEPDLAAALSLIEPSKGQIGAQKLAQLINDSDSDPEIYCASSKALDTMVRSDLFDLGSHTMSHAYANEVEPEILLRDLIAAQSSLTSILGRPARSLVMPKNQVPEYAIEAAKSAGFNVVRVNPETWLYRTKKRTGIEAKLVRLLRFLDAILPLVELAKRDALVGRKENGMALTTGNYFVRPLLPRNLPFGLHLLRLKLGYWICRLRNIPVHYWNHPHNFGSQPQRALANYETLLSWLHKQRNRGAVKFLTMADFSE